MRILTITVSILCALLIWGYTCAIRDAARAMERQARGFNWAIQGEDGAIRGCPGQYPEYADIDGKEYLISCWGKK